VPRIQVNNLGFHYWQSGQGPDIVLVHGLGGNLAGWHLGVVPELQQEYRVLTYDLRGHGRSDATPAGYTTGDMVQDLRGIIDALEIESAAVVGHSWGGDIAIHFAQLHPSYVSELIVIEGALLAPLASVYRSPNWDGWPYAIATLEELLGRPIPEENRFDLEYLLRQLIEVPIIYGPSQGRPRDEEVIFRVLDAYYGVLLAQKQVELAEQTVKTAQALVDASSSRVEAGTSVEADLLSAKFNLASRQQELIRARSNAELSRTRLETSLGTRVAPGQFPSGQSQDQEFPQPTSADDIELRALSHRPDIQAVASQVLAQQNGLKAAQSALGPQVNVFGSWEADNPHFTGGGNNNWMAGIEIRFDLFSRDKYAKVSIEKAQLSRAEAAKQVAEDNIRLDARRAYFDYDAARQMLDVSRSAIAQAEESLRIMRDRYDSGLVTITELLRAEDADRAGRTNYWESVYKDAISYAALQLATGDLNPQSPAVTQ